MKSFEEMLDITWVSSEGAVPGHGEDSFYCAVGKNSAVVSVFDGCGGLGSRVYPRFREHTGAYVASRLASGAVHDWFEETKGYVWAGDDELKHAVSRYLLLGLQRADAYAEGGLKLRGSMVRDFPTTAAIGYVQQTQNKLILYVLWAGDSRVYMMTENGLMQLTSDDIEGSMDAFSNLTDDGALTNVLSSDGRFDLHCKKIILREPAVIFAATDGCFGYIGTPMEFEYSILYALMQADTPQVFQEILTEQFKEVTGDDFALAMMSIGFGDYFTLQSKMEPRCRRLAEEYIRPLQEDESRKKAEELWGKYRKEYECCL